MRRPLCRSDDMRVVTLGLALLTAGIPAGAADSEQTRVITGATIIDGVSGTALPGYALVIEGDTIRELLSPADPLPEDAEVQDLSGQYIIPGLIDSHVH